MEQTLTAKALAHLPAYLPLQSFFLEQYYSNSSSGSKVSNMSGANPNSINQNSSLTYPSHSQTSQQQLENIGSGSSSALPSSYLASGNNSSTASSKILQSSQNQQMSLLQQTMSSAAGSSHQLQQLASQLQASSSCSSQSQQNQLLMMEMLSNSETSEEGNQQSTLQQLAHQQLNQLKKMEQKYKTELCKNWVSKGVCQYGQKCRFAHGKEELIERLAMNKNYKTKLCSAYHKEQVCQYAARCHFKHDERPVSEIRYQHFYQKHICSFDDESIRQFKFGQTPKRLPVFKQMLGIELTEEDQQINIMDIETAESNFSLSSSQQTNAALNQMMMLMLNSESSNILANQTSLQSSQSSQNSPFYLMNYPSNDSISFQNNINSISNFNTLSGQQNGNFYIPSGASFFNNNKNNSAKQSNQDKDLSMISNANTADTSESISVFSLADKYNSIPSTEKLVSTNLFA
ncbi:zinc finger C-x8-C-x5-C-x3-H type protein (macronuclear) [Tetrahymena thermophila SB210]|uniref:Zinc finger C-x8-C-x5-C-x3-H type protein n=1 Tax=Tetrahymena thermophila (strain SB210) TaxID=312017 RepID=Q233A9_TETTS|nr:zinc finger C-x8-C-x5-C-x3-H type protein [Tetrahymena thermophila SB210]EAR91671.1 zinc finger C-x8-C-x5-C-x3-H type protein [Tetrahymena thermophila SB210]|eukprot:XP_001011916.1 zinc finger C-x8-C-x5-C-x3-H type protein [Tetrahymena thermophila SB210]